MRGGAFLEHLGSHVRHGYARGSAEEIGCKDLQAAKTIQLTGRSASQLVFEGKTWCPTSRQSRISLMIAGCWRD